MRIAYECITYNAPEISLSDVFKCAFLHTLPQGKNIFSKNFIIATLKYI